MRAIQFSEPKTLRLIEIDFPDAPGPGMALVRTHRMGICGTDISCYLGKFPFFDFPRIPGHELGVEVVAVGSGAVHSGGVEGERGGAVGRGDDHSAAAAQHADLRDHRIGGDLRALAQ